MQMVVIIIYERLFALLAPDYTIKIGKTGFSSKKGNPVIRGLNDWTSILPSPSVRHIGSTVLWKSLHNTDNLRNAASK